MIPGLEGHPPPEELDPPGDPPPKPMLNPTLPEDLLLRGQKGERSQKREGQRGEGEGVIHGKAGEEAEIAEV